ncbi:MAG: hypothetical protein NVS4B3_12660 [Gemmatimonadaceae bacterium]
MPPLRFSRAATAAVLSAALSIGGAAQLPTPAVPLNGYDSSAFGALKWREIGPYRGGRSVAVAGSAARPYEYWMGTTGGGVFKTTDGGISWTAVTDRYFGGTAGAIGVAPSNPDIVYVGTGEYAIRGNVSHGDGVFKTTDAGKTWAAMGLIDSRHISRVRVDPVNPDLVYVGVQGHAFGPNPERGVYRSRDGGKTWQRILYRSDSTGVTDLVIDPTNPKVLYASFWQAVRRPWQLVSGGPESGIFKSVDGGDSWTEITRNPGLPNGLLGNIGLAVSPADGRRVWALVEADSGGVFRSDDAGATWSRVNDERKLRQRAWYYSRIFADPKDRAAVYVLNTGFYRSTNGGKTYKTIPVPHGDNHDLWIAPSDPQRMIEGNDGGANVSFNGGKTWSEQAFATAQFYHVTTTTDFPYHVCGAQQDNSTLCGPSASSGGIDIRHWYDVGGGESGYIAVRTDRPDVAFAGSYGGLLTRKDRRTGLTRMVNPWPDNPMGHSSEDMKYRFQWTFPIIQSPHDPNVIYAAGNVVFKTINEGASWTRISPDLTRHDPKTMGPSGGPITKDQTGVETYATIFALAESPVQIGVLWAGSDDGLIHLSRDAGKSWANVTPPAIGIFSRVSIIEPSHYEAGTVYVAANRYQLEDMTPSLWKTANYGMTWSRIDGGIPRTEFTRTIREDPARRGLLYAGTERGVWISFDDGAHWQKLQRNLPPVPVHDLAVTSGDLIAATHGRSFYIMDDLSALRQMTPASVTQPAHLFKPRDAYRVNWSGGFEGRGPHPRGQNPPNGVIVYYSLDKVNQEVTLDFLDGVGKVIKSFTSKLDSMGIADSLKKATSARVREDSLRKGGVSEDSVKKLQATSEESPPEADDDEDAPPHPPRTPRVANKVGLNAFVWNMRYPDASRFDNLIMWAGSTTGPIAPPGTYAVRMRAAGRNEMQRFAILRDPRLSASPQELNEQFALSLRIRDRLTEANDAVKTARYLKRQLDDRSQAAAGKQAATEIAAAARALADAATGIEGEIYQVKNRSSQDPLNYPIKLNNRLAALGSVVAAADGRPTAQSYVIFEELSQELDVQLRRMKSLLKGQLSPLNAMLRGAGLSEIVPKAEDTKQETPIASVSGRPPGTRPRQR